MKLKFLSLFSHCFLALEQQIYSIVCYLVAELNFVVQVADSGACFMYCYFSVGTWKDLKWWKSKYYEAGVVRYWKAYNFYTHALLPLFIET